MGLLGDEDVVHARPVRNCCCRPLTIAVSSLLVLALVCAAVVIGFIVENTIEQANVIKTPCTGKQTGDTCTMAANGALGVCKLDDSKFINDGELICDDVTPYEEACQQKDSDDTCVVKDMVPGRCMYTNTVSKVLWCSIPSQAEMACLGVDRKPLESRSECQLQVAGGESEKGTCEVVIYSRMKQCIIPDPDEEICASLKSKETCTTSLGKKGTCEQMMDNQLMCVEPAPVHVDLRIVITIGVVIGIFVVAVVTFGIFCYCRQKKKLGSLL